MGVGMKAIMAFLAVFSAAALLCRGMPAASSGTEPASPVQTDWSEAGRKLAQNRPATEVKPLSPRPASQTKPAQPGRLEPPRSAAARTPDARGEAAGRPDRDRPDRDRQSGHDDGSSGTGQVGFGVHHWGYGWREGYRPGEFRRPPPVPRRPQLFQHWDYLYDRSRFELAALPRELRVILRPGQSVSFQIEEDMTSGYRWMANYDRRYGSVEVAHRINRRSVWSRSASGATGVAEIEIQARVPGMLVIDLVYAKPQEWANGVHPTLVAQVFLQVEPR